MIKTLKNSGLRLLLLLAVFSLLLPANAVSQADKESAYRKIVDKYGNINSVSLNFISRDQKEFKGTFQAKRGNKYIVKTAGRTIVSNGKTIWNYSVKDKKVVISSIDDLSQGAVSLENFFFTVIKQFKPVALAREMTSKGEGDLMILSLVPKEKSKEMSDLEEVKLYYDPDNLSLKTIQIKAGKNSQTVDVSNVVVNKNLADRTFEFVAPKNAEVIDLR